MLSRLSIRVDPLGFASVGLLSLSIACSSATTVPSPVPGQSPGAVIEGTVTGAPRQGVPDVPPMAGTTVRVVGSSLSAVVAEQGTFRLAGVPAGNVRLQFTAAAVNASADLANVGADQLVQILVTVGPSTAVVVSETRTTKIEICHAEGNGTYHLVSVSEDSEAAHRAHGDGKVNDPVPGRANMVFDQNCRPVGPAIDIEKWTNGQDADSAPGPSIPVGSPVSWTYRVTNTGTVNLSAVRVVDDKGVVVNCNSQTTLGVGATMTCTGTGLVTTEGPYSNVGTATASWSVSDRSGSVTDSDPSHYLGISPIDIQKWTNGEDADTAPGPRIVVGSAVVWEYRLENIGAVTLSGISVTDDRGVTVDCRGVTSLASRASTTCTGSGVATLGQYRNVGRVIATWSAGAQSGTVTDSDPSHYIGVTPGEESGQKVTLCHRTGAGFYVRIDVGIDAEPAHRAHGDGKVGEAVPGSPGKVFSASCGLQ